MDVLDFIRDKFSQDCAIGTVLNLVMAHYDLSNVDRYDCRYLLFR